MMAAVLPWPAIMLAHAIAGLVSGIIGIIAVPVIGLRMTITVTGNCNAMSAIATVASIATVPAEVTTAVMLRHCSAGCQ